MLKIDCCCLAVLTLFLAFPGRLPAQTKSVSGKVINEGGKPLQGVSITIKGTSKGTLSNDSGLFVLGSVPENGTLHFSIVGYADKDVPVVSISGSDAVIVLHSSSSSLNDVQVTVGYGMVSKKDLTGAVGSVNMKDFDKAPVKSFDDALAGRVAGVVVQSSDGQPGSNANIVVRGAGSITQDQSPLYVVDGFPTESSNANSIAPADIESVEVLKDASATAIYGSRGANGVVLITTKKGKAGPPQLTYNAYYGWQATPKKMKMMDPYDFVKYVHEINPAYDSIYLQPPLTLDDYRNAPDLDMQDYVFHTGQNQNHNISLRGGNEKTRYALSGNFNNQDGVIINTGFKRYQGRFVLDQIVNSKLKVGVNVNYSYSDSYGNSVSAPNFYASATSLYSVWGWRPTAGLSGADSSINLLDEFYDPALDGNSAQDYRVNPLINLENTYLHNKNTTFTANGYAEYSFSSKLKLRITGGITNITQTGEYFNNTNTQSGSKWGSLGANGGVSTSPSTSWLNENMLTYTTSFHQNHRLSVMADISEQKNSSSIRSFSANQLPNEDLGLDGLDLAQAANTSIGASSTRSALMSMLGRINYDYKSKYLLTASFRADGSSKFAPDNRWGYFPSFAVAWRLSSEPFMKNMSFISDAKLRFGFGASGNNRVSDFAYLPTLDLSNINFSYSYNNQIPAKGALISAAGNPNLKWETSIQPNLGLDLSLLKNRVNLTVDMYKRKVKNLLLNAPLPYASGVLSQTGYENVGSLQNKGLEITLNTTNIDQRNFTWSSNLNMAFNQNKVLSLAPGQVALLSGSGTFFNTTYSTLSPYISTLGGSLGEMYGLVWQGVYQYSDFDIMPNGKYVLKPGIPDNGSGRANVQPGDIKYKDLNGDGTINNKDWTIIGNGLPTFTGGFSNDFRYKTIDLNILFQWSVGNDVINANRYIFEGGIVTNPNLNQFASYADRWEPDNTNTTMFRTGGYGPAAYSSRVVENGSYLKLRTISLGYNFPDALLQRMRMKSMRIYASAQNLLTFTGYSGQDPESSSRNSNLTPGFDYTAYPHSLSIVVGVDVTF